MKTFNPPAWKLVLRNNFTDWHKLADFLELSEENRQHIDKRPSFTLNMPLRLAQKVAKNELDDPILKQFLPTIAENEYAQGFIQDPIQDITFQKSDRLLQKYKSRALMISTGACAMHCRYCFRQNYEYPGKTGFEDALIAVEKDINIKELILSGGDPLSLSDDVLQTLLQRVNNISHVKRVRIHTRFPIGIPERIDESFLKTLASCQKQIWFVTHINHPQELDIDVLAALKRISLLGIPVLNQAVLLCKVNDDLSTMQHLCELLVDNGILPYYLHQLDRVAGAMHFEVPETEGLQLMERLKENLSGYAVPKYVKEIPGDQYKRSI